MFRMVRVGYSRRFPRMTPLDPHLIRHPDHFAPSDNGLQATDAIPEEDSFWGDDPILASWE
jgi:hypothetical protein